MKTNNTFLVVIIISIGLFNMHCESDDVEEEIVEVVNFEKAQLNYFPLSEVEEGQIEGFSIRQPSMLNGVPQNNGSITLTLSYTDIASFSLKEVEFDLSMFSISPGVGERSIIPGKTITYTITPVSDSSVSLRYDVRVMIKGPKPPDQALAIDRFRFLSMNNPGLDTDIISTEIRKTPALSKFEATIVMIVPDGTDFSDLVPTIDFEGSTLTYHTTFNGGDSDFKVFDKGTSLNFKYPNLIHFRVYNGDRSKFSEYRVIVEVKEPIIFDETSVTINDGNLIPIGIVSYDNVVSFTNYGNYPITSDLSVSTIEVTETPGPTPKNYYNLVILKEDNSFGSHDVISNGEKGRLYVQVNFFDDFIGSPTGLRDYKIEAEFNTLLYTPGTPNIKKDVEFGGLEEYEFFIYDPFKIELIAKVFVN
ncbi:hypothetical protein FNH22_11105 [Fulvivirga sp. M361]|uniref:hypothetical protein n=1 Tax=Fulvivirga sp. M361 TaxID=2594266 RepID=UPI00117AA344|nr:hypothetical protein [Fulvivirga sp. M361]TRX59068.1 hypothetical protein FNH22_11105 [Fulvivirga sp. M361]